MDAGPRIDSYAWSGGREAMLRWGPEDGPVVTAALPLLEEANRTRAFVVSILRALAGHGIGSMLPDLPGQGESLLPTKVMQLADLRAAYAAAARTSGARVFGLAVRSGALLDGEAHLCGRWRLSPQTGNELLREWRRMTGAGADHDPVDVAGNQLSRELVGALVHAPEHPDEGGGPDSTHMPASTSRLSSPQLDAGPSASGQIRVVRLVGDPRPADLHLEDTPLWRRSEPANDLSLAQTLAADIVDWIARCDG